MRQLPRQCPNGTPSHAHVKKRHRKHPRPKSERREARSKPKSKKPKAKKCEEIQEASRRHRPLFRSSQSRGWAGGENKYTAARGGARLNGSVTGTRERGRGGFPCVCGCSLVTPSAALSRGRVQSSTPQTRRIAYWTALGEQNHGVSMEWNNANRTR